MVPEKKEKVDLTSSTLYVMKLFIDLTFCKEKEALPWFFKP
jgi:hypothetical protein